MAGMGALGCGEKSAGSREPRHAWIPALSLSSTCPGREDAKILMKGGKYGWRGWE